VTLNGAQAATRAGYSGRTARVTTSKLLTKANIAAALEAGYKERQARNRIVIEGAEGPAVRWHSSDRSTARSRRTMADRVRAIT